MKRLIAMLLALMLLATLPALAEAAQEEAPAITLERMRYFFEHDVMPRYFHEDPQVMLDVLKERGIYPLWSVLADENGVEYPYQEEDFSLSWYDVNGATVLQIGMPAPEVSPQCFRIYMVYDPATGSAGYYTIEYDNLLGETAFLCAWTADRTHMNYGGAEILDPSAEDYQAQLDAEAEQVASMLSGQGE